MDVIGRTSAEQHDAHLAFVRANIVQAAANREPLLDRLQMYAADVRRAERDRIGAEVESLRAIMATAVEELANPSTCPGDEVAWRDRVADAVEVMRAALGDGDA